MPGVSEKKSFALKRNRCQAYCTRLRMFSIWHVVYPRLRRPLQHDQPSQLLVVAINACAARPLRLPPHLSPIVTHFLIAHRLLCVTPSRRSTFEEPAFPRHKVGTVFGAQYLYQVKKYCVNSLSVCPAPRRGTATLTKEPRS